MFLSHKPEKITPEEFKDEPIGAFITPVPGLVFFYLVINVLGGKGSLRKPRGKLGRVVGPQQPIACLFVFFDVVAVPKVLLKSLQSRFFTPTKRECRSGILLEGLVAKSFDAW